MPQNLINWIHNSFYLSLVSKPKVQPRITPILRRRKVLILLLARHSVPQLVSLGIARLEIPPRERVEDELNGGISRVDRTGAWDSRR